MHEVGADILPWERLLWRGRPVRLAARARGVHYALTDFRVICTDRRRTHEIALQDVAEVHLSGSRLDRVMGARTIRLESRRTGVPPLVLEGVRRGDQLAALFELLSGQPQARLDARAVEAALAWEPRPARRGRAESLAAIAVATIAVGAVVVAGRGHSARAVYAADDPIYPRGEKRSEEAISHFMEAEVMPWARGVLGPLKGGADRINCETCHGRNPAARGWRMPAVAALPQPDLRDEGWERYSETMDAQMRNAIYGYLAESEKQYRAGYMREVVMPGMARLLRRPPYDFTRTYAYNRSQAAFGCYHCHRVK